MILRFLLCLCVFESAFAQSKVEQAQKLYESRKYPEAISLLSAVKKDDKEFAGAQYWLGRVAYDQKRLDDAEEFFEEAVDADEAPLFEFLAREHPNNIHRHGLSTETGRG